MIVRHPRKRNFTILGNEALRQRALSFRARGILAYLLSFPDDHRVNSQDLADASAVEGRDAIRTALSELEAAGYIERIKVRQADGTIVTETHVYDEPETGQPAPDSQAPVPPAETDESPGHTGDGSTGAGQPGALRSTGVQKDQKKNDPARAEVVEIVDHLRRRVAAHLGREIKTSAWAGPIDLLLRRGDPEWANPEPIPAREVHAMVDFIFDHLAVRDRGFCWADQIRSGANLRAKWGKLETARKRGRQTNNADVAREVIGSYDAAGIEPGSLFGVTP